MSRLYKRNVQVIIGEDDGSALKVTALKIEFEIKKVLSGNKTEGTVTIYNLSELTETRIREQGTRLRLLAGYGSDYITLNAGGVALQGSEAEYEKTLSVLYDGQISAVERGPVGGQDRVTHITIKGNTFKLTSTATSVSYEGAVPVRTIVSDAAESIDGLGTGSRRAIPADAELTDFAFSGRAVDLLTQVLEPLNVQWVEVDGLLEFSARSAALAREVFVLAPGSGLIGPAGTTDKGVKVRAQLNGRLDIGGPVIVRSEALNSPKAAEADGRYKIIQLVHKGSNWDGEFVTEFEGVPLE